MATNEEYRTKLEQQIAQYRDVDNIHDLPRIYHYWARRYLEPAMQALFRTGDPVELFANAFAERARGAPAHFLSIGAGDCSVEVEVARRLKARDVDFALECAELSGTLLERGRDAAARAGVAERMLFSEVDVNFWRAPRRYDAVMAHHSLHHIVQLEKVFDEIRTALLPDGVFVVADIIGRNGHMRWPEALRIVEAIWSTLPERRKYNHQLKRVEQTFVNWDCSGEGFEGIRAQDILPLLIERFDFREFLAFGNLTDVFVERSFGHNYDPDSAEDRRFIDRLHAVNDLLIDLGVLKPTMLIATMRPRSPGNPPPTCHRNWSPDFCVRRVPVAAGTVGADATEQSQVSSTEGGGHEALARLEAEIARLTERLDAETAMRQRLVAQLDAMLSSTSWRVTAPLRWLRRNVLARRVSR